MINLSETIDKNIQGWMHRSADGLPETISLCAGMTQAEAAVAERATRSNKPAPKGALAHHAWIRQWREETRGTLEAGREAWKMLDTKEKWQFKIEYADHCMTQTKAGTPSAARAVPRGSSSNGSTKKKNSLKAFTQAVGETESSAQVVHNVDSKPQRAASTRRRAAASASTRDKKAKPRPMKRA